MTVLMEQFAHRLKYLRHKTGLTQIELAEQAKISVNFLRGLEQGRFSASFKTLESLAKALGVPVKDLFDFGIQ